MDWNFWTIARSARSIHAGTFFMDCRTIRTRRWCTLRTGRRICRLRCSTAAYTNGYGALVRAAWHESRLDVRAGARQIYGEDFLVDCARFNVPLTLVHYEPFDAVLDLGEVRIDATGDREIRDFLHDCDRSFPPTENYRYQAARFCFKAFAMTRPDIRDTDWLVWLDADVRMHNDPDWRALLNHRAD